MAKWRFAINSGRQRIKLSPQMSAIVTKRKMTIARYANIIIVNLTDSDENGICDWNYQFGMVSLFPIADI